MRRGWRRLANSRGELWNPFSFKLSLRVRAPFFREVALRHRVTSARRARLQGVQFLTIRPLMTRPLGCLENSETYYSVARSLEAEEVGLKCTAAVNFKLAQVWGCFGIGCLYPSTKVMRMMKMIHFASPTAHQVCFTLYCEDLTVTKFNCKRWVNQSHDRVSGVVTRIWTGHPRSRSSIPGRGKDLSPLQSGQTDSGTSQAPIDCVQEDLTR